MNKYFLLALSMIFFNPLYFQIGFFNPYHKLQTTQDFHYPESSEIVEIATPLNSRALSGKIIDPTGCGISSALIEIVDSDWKNPKNAILTNSRGRFNFQDITLGKYFLKISKPGFKTLLVKVIIKRSSKSLLKISLPLDI